MFNDYISKCFGFSMIFLINTKTRTVETHAGRRAEINKNP